MKRLLSIFVIFLMVFSLLMVCGKTKDGQQGQPIDQPSESNISSSYDDDFDDTVMAPSEWFDGSNNDDEKKAEHEAEYGTLTIKLPTRIFTGYPAVEIETVFSKPEKAEELTFTSNVDSVKIENGKVYVIASTTAVYTATITAKSENFEAETKIFVETYQGSTGSGTSLGLETQITVRNNLITAQSNGDTADMVLFVGDTLFSPDGGWTSFYTDYATKKAYTVGISSTTTEDWQIISERLVYPYSPKAVVVHCGANDIFDDKDSGVTTATSLITLFKTYHERMPDTKIYWFTIEPKAGQSSTEVDAANRAVAEFAADKDWLVVIAPKNESHDSYMQALTDAGLVIDNK